MERLLEHLNLEDSDDDLDEDNLEPLDAEELKLMMRIKELIRKRKYKDVSILFTTGKKASSNMDMLPKMSMHLYKDVCKKHLTEDTCESNDELYKCAEELLKLIANCAPVNSFLIEMMLLLGPDSPDCVFTSALSVLQSPLLRVTDVDVFEDCLDEIILRRDVYAPTAPYTLIADSEAIEARLNTDDELQYFIIFHVRVGAFYFPLLKEICSKPRSDNEIFRCCETNKRNVLCCFLIKMLEQPLALFNLSCSEAKENNQCPLFFAVALTTAITKCIGDPFYLLSYAETKVRWSSSLNSTIDGEENGNHFLKEFSLETGCLAIYYYMVIVEEVCLSAVPKVYNPLYVCEAGLHLVHFLLTDLPAPSLQDKALRLAQKLLRNLRRVKIPSSYMDSLIFKIFLDDLRKLALNPTTANVLLQTVEALKQYVLSFVNDDRYLILKSLLDTVNHSSFCGYLLNVYKDLAAEALNLPSSSSLPEVFTGQKFRAIFMENMCKLQQGVKTDPSENNDQIEVALESIILFASLDNENRTGFWCFVNEIQSQFISPLRKALNFYESRFKTELLNTMQGRGASRKRGRGVRVSQTDKSKRIDTLKNNLSDVTQLRRLVSDACERLLNSPIEDKNNNFNTAKTK